MILLRRIFRFLKQILSESDREPTPALDKTRDSVDTVEELKGDVWEWARANQNSPHVQVVRLPSGYYAFSGNGVSGWGFKTPEEARRRGDWGPDDRYEAGAD